MSNSKKLKGVFILESIRNFFHLLFLCVYLLILSSLFCVVFIISIISTIITLILTCIDDLIKSALEYLICLISSTGFLENKTRNKEGDDNNEFI